MALPNTRKYERKFCGHQGQQRGHHSNSTQIMSSPDAVQIDAGFQIVGLPIDLLHILGITSK
jgi:hypothetical protein